MSDRRIKPKPSADASPLADAVKAWIRAEYLFRYGPHAYQRQEQRWWEQAEKDLRRIVTGQGDLDKAYEDAK